MMVTIEVRFHRQTAWAGSRNRPDRSSVVMNDQVRPPSWWSRLLARRPGRRPDRPGAAGGDPWLARLVESSGDAIIGMEPGGTIVSWNEGARRLFGYSEEEATGRPVAMLCPADRLDELSGVLERLGRGESISGLETLRVAKSGRMIDAATTACPVRDGEGRLIGFSAIARDISERVRAEQGLMESEARYRSLFENAAVGIAHIGLDGRLLRVNQTLCEIVGYSPDELKQKTWQQLTHPDDLAADLEIRHAFLELGASSRSWEKRYIHKDGRPVWVGMTVSLVRDDLERPSYFVTVVQDIGPRRRAEQARRESEERLHLALRWARGGAWEWDIARGRVYWSPEFYDLLGLDSSVLPGVEEFFGLFRPEDRPAFDRQTEPSLEGQSVFEFQLPLPHPSQGLRWYSCRGRTVRDGAGRPVRMIGFLFDITESRRAEDELRRREQEFQALVEHSPDLITRVDLDGRHLYANPTVELASGIPRGRFLGRTNRELGLPDSICRRWEVALREAIDSGSEVDFEFRFDGPNGSRSFLGRYVPESDAEGRVVSVLGIGIDISERRALQEQLLAIATREQRRIAQDLHDDVGQELTGAALMADAMVQALASQGMPEAGRAARIRDMLGGLQQRVRDLCRGLMPVEVDAGGLMSALADLADQVDAMDGLRCTFECPDPVAVAAPRTATHLYRIAQEAVSNAIKHGGARHVCIGLRGQGRGLRLEIRDDGRGFPPRPRPREGMGLKIMRYRAELIGGMLEVGPVRGGGSEVSCQVEAANGGGSTDED